MANDAHLTTQAQSATQKLMKSRASKKPAAAPRKSASGKKPKGAAPLATVIKLKK